MDALTFPSQFDMTTGYFNNQLPVNESTTNLGTNYPDLNFGIGWSKKLRYFEPEAGLSFFHLGLIFILPFLIILVIYELYILIKSHENK